MEQSRKNPDFHVKSPLIWVSGFAEISSVLQPTIPLSSGKKQGNCPSMANLQSAETHGTIAAASAADQLQNRPHAPRQASKRMKMRLISPPRFPSI
jgi:hypothetical protein